MSAVGTGKRTLEQPCLQAVSSAYWISVKEHLFSVQVQILGAIGGSCDGSSIRPVVANLFMESFECQTLSTAPNSPSLLLRYVDDTFVVMETSSKSEFLNHINVVEPNIKFTVKKTRYDGDTGDAKTGWYLGNQSIQMSQNTDL